MQDECVPLLAGVGVREITPTPEMIDDSLHRTMSVRLDEAGAPLLAKALALTQGDTQVMLVALDLCLVMTDQAELVRRRAAEFLGWPPETILLSCSHSHSTPFLEPLDGPHPFLDFITERIEEAVVEARDALQPARGGWDVTHVVGASFNTRVPQVDGTVKYTRDFREGLASGRPIDPRLSVVRWDDMAGRPLAGWVRFAAHPACVIFDAPVSAEYPGYLADQLSRTAAQGAPVLFGYGASGDVNCVPMFGSEQQARQLGHNLAAQAATVFESIVTREARCLRFTHGTVPLPLDSPPDIETLDREIAELESFLKRVARDPAAEWVIGINCPPTWPGEKKRGHVTPLLEWARKMKQAVLRGDPFPHSWPTQVSCVRMDDLVLAFVSGEPLVELGLELSSRTPDSETLLLAQTNGSDGYIGTDQDRRRGGYELYTGPRYALLKPGRRPLPYAPGAGAALVEGILELME